MLIGGLLAMGIRYQLAYPGVEVPLIGKLLPSTIATDGIILPGGYNMFFTMHATVMVFLVVMPLLIGGFGNYLIPLKIGAGDMAFPTLNAMSYWLYVLSGIVIVASFFVDGGAAQSGWTAYAPLSSTAAYSNNTQIGQSLWCVGLFINGLSSIAGATNYITTIINMRAPGMTMFRLPLSVWALFITAWLLLLAVPAAAVSAWWSLRGVIVSAMPRAWASVTWAVLPAVTGALAGGLLGTLAAAILLPPTVRAVVRALGYGGRRLPSSGRTVWWAALLVAATTACVPLAWVLVVLAVIAALVAAVIVGRRLDSSADSVTGARSSIGSVAIRGAALVLVPLVLLLPWSLHLLAQPALLLSQPGLIDGRLAMPAASALDLMLLQPGGPSSMPAWIGAALVVAALLGLLRPDRRGAALVAWGVGAVALLIGIVMLGVRIEVPGIAEPQALWPGVPTLVLGGALILAAALAADGLKDALESASFDFVRTPIAYVLPWIAIIAPLLWAIWWVVPGSGDPVRRGDPDVLPPFVAAEAVGPQAPRTLLLRADPESGTYYTLVNGAGLRLGDADTSPPTSVWDPVDDLVSGLVSGRGGAEVAGLARYAVRYVVLDSANAAPALVRTLDAVPGLRRLAGQGNEVLWKVEIPTARAQQADAEDPPALNAIPVQDLVTADPLASAALPEPGPGRILLSQSAEGGWFASVGGETLAGVDVDGLQEFEVPAGIGAGGAVTIGFDDSARGRWLIAQLIALLVVIVLALPARRRITDDDVADVDTDEDDVAVLAADGIVPAGDAGDAGEATT